MARDPYYAPDAIFLDKRAVEDISWDFPTPLYVYDAAGIRRQAGLIRDAFGWNPENRHYFPVKALNTPAVLRLLLEESFGLLCTSALELQLARRAGARKDQLLFVPLFPDEMDLRSALELQTPMILDSEAVLDGLLALGGLPSDSIGLRIRPVDKIAVGVRSFGRAEHSKFGMEPEEALRTAARLQKLGLGAVGLHCHLTGNVTEEAYWAQLAQMLLQVADTLRQRLGMQIAYLDLGGGLGIPGLPSETMPDIGRVAALVHERMEQAQELSSTPVYTEFGRYVTGTHGLLLSRVLQIKDGPRPLLGLDASYAQLLRKAIFQTHHHISLANNASTADRRFYELAGQLAEKTDRFSSRCLLPKVRVGDLIVIHNAGAYCASMQLSYCGRLRCAEYLYENETLRCIRRAETPEDYFATFDEW